MELNIAIMEVIESDDEDIPINDSETSSSDDDSDFAKMLEKRGGGSMKRIPRIKGYMEKVVARYNSEVFKSHFRLYRETFEFVLGLVGAQLCLTRQASGRKPIDPKKQLLIALWMFATPDSYRSVCEKFNVGRATALRSVRRVSHALHCLAPRFIKWPQGPRATEVMRDFERYSGFPNIVGCIDGTHIQINAPKVDGQSYINRKGTHSVQVQVVCTRNLLFTSVYAGHVGSVHDSRVFRLSPVQQYIESPDVFFPNNSHLVGDAAYGIHSNIMVPFKDNGHLTLRQRNFNFCVSSARISIERAIGVWKGRWRSILNCLPMVTVHKIPKYLLAVAVLHNICILRGDLIQHEATEPRVRPRGRLVQNGREEGIEKRQEIMNNLVIRNI